jgi:hypothetical protein
MHPVNYWIIIIVSIVLLIKIPYEFYLEYKAKKFWEQWKQNSFEHNGYRLNKDLYEIVNGEIKEKHA